MTYDRTEALRELLRTMTWNELIDVHDVVHEEGRVRHAEYAEQFYAHLATKLTAAREAKGLTITQAAAAAKMARSTLVRSERSGVRMAGPTLVKLADAYEVSLDWLTDYPRDPRLHYVPPAPSVRLVTTAA